MKTFRIWKSPVMRLAVWRWMVIALSVWLSAVAHAGRISEPDTTFYGKITQQLGGREFLVTSGELVWTIKTTGPGAGEYRFATQLQPLAEGQYSYKIRIPHQLLAYDLSVAERAMPMPASGARIQEIAVTLDDQLLMIAPQMVGSIAFAPDLRAAAYRVDLQSGTVPLDSDGDGLPDWWEDAHGLDKWDPSDGSQAVPSGGNNPGGLAPNAHTFAEWRAALFPSVTGTIQAFANLDSDGDGIPNLLEYALDLDPRKTDTDLPNIVPHLLRGSSGLGVSFRKRTLATDLEFHIDTSTDLLNWTDSTGDLDVVAEPNTGHTTVQPNHSAAELPTQFYRVRVVCTSMP